MVVTVRKFVQRHVLTFSNENYRREQSRIQEEHFKIRTLSLVTITRIGVAATFQFYIPNCDSKKSKNSAKNGLDVRVTVRMVDENDRVMESHRSFLPKQEPGICYTELLPFGEFDCSKEILMMEFEWEIEGRFPSVEREKKWDFGVADRNLTDVVLVVEEQKFHVNKAILATHSSYFHNLFFGSEFTKSVSTFHLENILAETLQSLLEILYHTPNVHIDNAENVLKAGRMYSIPLVSDHCKQVIVDDGRVPRDEKRRLAEEFGIDWEGVEEEEEER